MDSRVVRAAIGLLPAVVVILSAAHVEAQVNPLWDHYKVYEVPPTAMYEPANVTLTDQFLHGSGSPGALVRFMNPVEKTHGPIVYAIHDSITHYAWRNLVPTQPYNQFWAVSNQ